MPLLARLPVTGGDVFGRDEDVAFLDDAWANQHVNIVTIVDWAGVGKSALDRARNRCPTCSSEHHISQLRRLVPCIAAKFVAQVFF
jgi:hypothetical protein